jgi:hypothetical protein
MLKIISNAKRITKILESGAFSIYSINFYEPLLFISFEISVFVVCKLILSSTNNCNAAVFFIQLNITY